MRVMPGVESAEAVEAGETCGVCCEPYQGGPKTYQGVDRLWRASCADEKACWRAYWRRNPIFLNGRWHGPDDAS